MSQDRELEIQLQFLDEAREYLSPLEEAVLGLAQTGIDIQKINAAMRAAHSIKGGAGMMGFHILSRLAHRLEDSLKVLKIQKHSLEINGDLEALLLAAIGCMSQVIEWDYQACLSGEALEGAVAPQWLETQANPVFDQLHQRLGDPEEEDAHSVLSPEEGQDVIPLLFQTEVAGCLERLETVMATQSPHLREELDILAQELGGLGEMLQLSAFSQLCESVQHCLAALPDRVEAVAEQALAAWRRSQALVLTGHLEELPTALEGFEIAATERLEDWPILSEDELPQESDLPDLTDTELDWSALEMDELEADEFDLSKLDVPESLQPEVVPATAETTPEIAAAHDAHDASDAVLDFTPDAILNSTPNTAWDAEQNLTIDATTISNTLPDTASDTISGTTSDRAGTTGNSGSMDVWQMSAPAKVQSQPNPRVLEVKPGVATGSAVQESGENTVRVPVKQLNQLGDLFGELTIERNGLELYLKRVRDLVTTLSRRVRILDQSNQQLRAAYDQITTQTFPQSSSFFSALNSDSQQVLHQTDSAAIVPIGDSYFLNHRFDALEFDRYNTLHLLSQEMMETIVQIQEVTTDIELGLDDAEQTSRNLNKTSRQLQTKLTQVRMRPISDIVDRFPRAIRELSLQHGKPVELKVVGANTLVDRNILEALNEPLMHLMRNAFDHGIEAPETRRMNGKPEQGTIEIRATHHQSRTIITVRDDGGGIPLDKIRARARHMGLDEVLLAAASDEELLSLIFEPGFSTSDRVTDLSGRGVGMDVVRERLKQVRGEIRVETEAGVGTAFILSLPYTLSVTRVLLVESNSMLLALPTDAVEEMIVLQENQVLSTAGSEAFEWEGQIVQLTRLRHWLRFNCPRQVDRLERHPAISTPTVLMVSYNNQPVGIEVDRCWGEQEVAIRQVEGKLSLPPGFSSCTILGDGRVVPLVSVTELLRWVSGYSAIDRADAVALMAAADAGQPTALPWQAGNPPIALPSSRKATILIVDDSINVRRFLALTLEKAGYQVEQAKDGQDALEKLLSGLEVQAVICDIEMPRLDGYGFLARVKANPSFEQLPIAMLTSRSGDKHRQLAMNLGATAYFSKPYNEQALLQTLAQVTAVA